MANAAIDFATLEPANLPSVPASLDIWILRDQNIILTRKLLSDEALSLKFDGFIDRISQTFSQTITVQSQPFNQALIIKDKKFKFVRMDGPETYLAKKTKKLTQIATLFQQIISQEISFLEQLTSFTKMLQDAEIFTTPMPLDQPTSL